MLEKIGAFLYYKVFININITSDFWYVYVEKIGRKGVIGTDEKKFETTSINEAIIKYINFFTKDTPYFYISVLDPSITQGAAPTCEYMEVTKFYDKALCTSNCYKNKWSFYTSKYDLDELETHFIKLGVDLIFSPFVILTKFFKEKIDSSLSIFILIQEDVISLSIFDNSELLFAQHLNLKNEFDSDDFSIDDDIDDLSLEEPPEESIDLDSVDIEDSLDDLDVFGDIEDLDSIEEIDEFTDVDDDLEDVFEEAISETSHKNNQLSGEDELFDEDYQMFTAIQTSIKTFYEDDKYNSQFVESIYIADSIGINGDLKNYLEEEMFLNVYVRQINLGLEISKLAQVELK